MDEMKTLTLNGQAYSLADTWARQSLKALQLDGVGAPVIISRATGAPVSLSDASDRALTGLTLYGKTTQDGTPAPDAPVTYTAAGGGSVTVTVADAAQENAQALTLELPKLHGQATSKNANYTDESGQKWCCDAVDLARGVKVTWFTEIVLTGQEEGWTQNGTYENVYQLSQGHIAWKTVCSHYPNAVSMNDAGNAAVICDYTRYIQIKDVRFANDVEGFKAWLAEQYAAGTPVTMVRRRTTSYETALTDAELEAYTQAALHTYKPGTTVANDGGCGMAVEYAADTKTYIDQKFTQLQNAILAAGANV